MPSDARASTNPPEKTEKRNIYSLADAFLRPNFFLMQDASTILAVDPLTVPSENLALQREIEHLRSLNAELLATINKQKSQIEQFEARLDWLVRQHFAFRAAFRAR